MSAEEELEKLKASIEYGLAFEVYEFLEKAASMDCNVASVLGGKPCGKCAICLAKVVERKVRERYVTHGWKNFPCKTCKGSGIAKPKRPRN